MHCQLCSVNCTVNCTLSTVHCQPNTVNCALSIVHCQLCTVNLNFQLCTDRLRRTGTRSAAACVVAQQYSSATFMHWAFIGTNKIWALFTPVAIDTSFCLYNCAGRRSPVLTFCCTARNFRSVSLHSALTGCLSQASLKSQHTRTT